MGCKDDAGFLQGIFLFLEVVESPFMYFLNMYTIRSFVRSFLHFSLLCMSCGRVASLFFIVVYMCVPTASNAPMSSNMDVLHPTISVRFN